MKRASLILIPAAALLLSCLSACKGRTASDMTPTGDTVEVMVPGEAPSDSAAMPVSSEEQPDSTEMSRQYAEPR